MEKEIINIKGLYRLKKNDLYKCADIATQAFMDDPACKFLFSSKLTYKSLYEYFLVIFKALYEKMYIFADCKNFDGFIIIVPIKYAKLTLFDFLKAGGLKIILQQGLGLVFRSINYEKNCNEIRDKIIKTDDWYIFQFGVAPNRQGLGIGSKIIRPILEWFKLQKISCYLETYKKTNVDMYKHLGFLLKSIDTLPNKEYPQYAMLMPNH